MADPAILLHDVRFAYANRRKLEAPILVVPELRVDVGERVFLHGLSGSGKTTLLNVIAGVLVPQHGSVHVLGQEFTTLSNSARDKVRGADIGFIFQSFNLIPYLSVRQNIALPCMLHTTRRARIAPHNLDQEMERIAQQLDITALLDRPVDRLSVGQQQRVAIARAVLGRPILVVADEPTSALDQDRQEQFLSLLFRMCDDTGSVLLFVSHARSLAHRFSRSLAMTEINQAAASTDGKQ